MKFDKKFSFNQLLTNNNGKSSLSGLAGGLIVLTGVLSFICGIVGWFLKFPEALQLLNIVILFTTTGAGLLGLRKLKKDEPEKDEDLSA